MVSLDPILFLWSVGHFHPLDLWDGISGLLGDIEGGPARALFLSTQISVGHLCWLDPHPTPKDTEAAICARGERGQHCRSEHSQAEGRHKGPFSR